MPLPSLRGALATKQSRGRMMRLLDCFAALAMTAGSWLVYFISGCRLSPCGGGRRERHQVQRLRPKRSRPEMSQQRLEKIESAPGNGRASEASSIQDVVHGR